MPREADASQSNISLVKTATLNSRRDADDDTSVTPSNLKRTLTTPSISSQPSSRRPELTNSPGLRAAEAYVRPSPIAVVGNIEHYNFDLKSCTFTLKLRAFQDATDDIHTVIFLPDFHFPQDTCTVEVSSGKWQISSDEEEIVLIQKLRWWHGSGEQSIKITGLARKHNIVEGVNDETGYYEQISNWLGYGNCSVM